MSSGRARAVLAAIAMMLAVGVPARAQAPTSGASAATGSNELAVGGDVPHPATVTAADLAGMPRHDVHTPAIHGQPEATYSGVWLRDILARSGAQFGDAIRGPALATYVVCAAADNYRVVFTLASLDSAFGDRPVLVADRRDGQPLAPHDGPYRLIVPGDARPARWLRMLTTITVANPPH